MKLFEKRNSTLIDAILPGQALWVDTALVAGFAVLTALCSQLSFWIGPVPITGQTFAVLISGAALGSRRGALAQLSYVAVGVTGLPFWFAAGGAPGIARLLGPTGGYLIGFVAAAFITGWLCERGLDRKVWTTTLTMLCGSACIYVFGLSWLVGFTGFESVLKVGLYPFITGDLIKIVLAAIALPSAWRLSHINL